MMQANPAHAEAAVRAYCLELCDPAKSERAIIESLHMFKPAGSPTTDPGQLLRIARATVAEHMQAGTPSSEGPGLSPEKRRYTCARTPAGLAASANDQLLSGERHQLEAHLNSCLRCQATELRMRRADRAFATTLAGAGTVAVLSETAQPPLPLSRAATAALEAPSHPEKPVLPPEKPVATQRRDEPLAPAPRRRPAPPSSAPHRTRLLAVAGTMISAGVVAAVLLLSANSSNHSTPHARAGAPASLPSSAASVPPVATTPRTSTPAGHASPAGRSPAPNGANAGTTGATSPVVQATPATATTSPVVRAAPSPSAPNPPAPPSAPLSPPSGNTAMRATPQNPGLPAVPGPMRGIGPGGPSGSRP